MILALFLAFKEKYFQSAVLIALLAYLFLVSLDLNRLQAYYYQYWIILLFLVFFRKNENLHLSLYILLAGIYFHSGLCKLNPNFLDYIFPNMLYAFRYYSVEMWQESSIKFIAYGIPLGEMLLALLLLVPRTRSIALVLSIVLHLGILYSIGPFGLNWNKIVWIWNIGMILLNFLLFQDSKELQFIKAKALLPLLATIFFFILPFFHYFHLWPNVFSFTLYSGKTPNAKIYLSNYDKIDAPILYNAENDSFIDLNVWYLRDLNTAIYPQQFAVEALAEKLCNKLDCEKIEIFEVYTESVNYVE
ncbi:MAG: hypothetical protein H6579_10585 [Chitinophagales bacterium]|nr:hypothetical protein [Chitinophagales bacterium]